MAASMLAAVEAIPELQPHTGPLLQSQQGEQQQPLVRSFICSETSKVSTTHISGTLVSVYSILHVRLEDSSQNPCPVMHPLMHPGA